MKQEPGRQQPGIPSLQGGEEVNTTTQSNEKAAPAVQIPVADLRDYFAAKALQGLLAQSKGTAYSSDADVGAAYAYGMADAMLRAREAK